LARIDVGTRTPSLRVRPRLDGGRETRTRAFGDAAGLSARQLRAAESRRAGIRARDIILGIDGRKMEMEMLQFNAHVRLNYKVGDRIVFNVIRNGMRQDISMELTSRIKK
jgi:S1-C subfamily serine protease